MNATGLTMALLAVSLGLGLWGYVQDQRADEAEERAFKAEEKVRRYQYAQDALDAHLAEVQAERDRWMAIASELEKEEGSDQDLSPYLRGVLGRVRSP